jgi:hypothetical protein
MKLFMFFFRLFVLPFRILKSIHELNMEDKYVSEITVHLLVDKKDENENGGVDNEPIRTASHVFRTVRIRAEEHG